MGIADFHTQLSHYIKTKNTRSALEVILNELGTILAKDKADFVEVLNNAGISAHESEPDLALLNKFVQNAEGNRTLLLGAAFLIHHKNKVTNFDGEEEVSDAGVKVTYKVLNHYFTGEEYSGFPGIDAVVKEVVGAAKGIYDKESDKRQKREFGVSDALAKQQEARKQMINSIVQARQAQLSSAQSKKKKTSSTTTILIVGGILAAVLVTGLIIYKVRSRK